MQVIKTVDSLLTSLDSQNLNDAFFSNAFNEFNLFKKRIVDINDSATESADEDDYFRLFSLLKSNNNLTTSNMMWAEMLFSQENAIQHINFINNRIEQESVLHSNRFKEMDGWETLHSETSKSKNKKEVLAPMGALDALFCEPAPVEDTTTLSNLFSITKQDNLFYVRFKMGLATENAFFDLDNSFYFSSVKMENGFERFNILSKTDAGYVQIVASINKDKKELHIYNLNEDLSYVDGQNHLNFISFLNMPSYVRIASLKNDLVNSFNSELFNLDMNDKVANSIINSRVDLEEGFNLFKEPEMKGFDFVCTEDKDLKTVQTQKKEELVDFLLVRGHSHKDFGRKANAMSKELSQPSCFLLREFSTLEVQRLLLSKPETIALPLMDQFKPESIINAEKMLAGNHMKYEATEALTLWKSHINPDFGRAVIKDSNLCTVSSFNEMEKNYAIYQTEIVDQEYIDSFKWTSKPLPDLKGYSYSFADLYILTHMKKVKNTFGFISIYKDEHKDSIYRNLMIDESIQKELSLSPIRQDTFLFDKRIHTVENLKEMMESCGAKEIEYKNMELPVFDSDDVLLENERSEDEMKVVFKVKISHKEYYETFKDFESFENSNIIQVFLQGIKEDMFLEARQSDMNEFTFVLEKESENLSKFEEHLKQFTNINH